MASPDHTKPILQCDNHQIKQILLCGPAASQQSLFSVPDHRRRLNLPLEQRKIIESNFLYQTTSRPCSSWSWEQTEKYVHHKDTRMLEYLYDHPIVDWVVDAQEARYGVQPLLAREGTRKLGLSIYAEDTPFSWWIRGEAAPVDDTLVISNEVESVEDGQEEVEDVEEMEVEQESAIPEPPLASPWVSPLEDPAASGGPRGSEDERVSDLPQHDATEEPRVKPELRRSARVVQQKFKEHRDQQTKEESIDPKPHAPQTKRAVASAKRSRRKTVEAKQQDDQRPRRRSTRVSAKRTFADEPWSMAKKKST